MKRSYINMKRSYNWSYINMKRNSNFCYMNVKNHTAATYIICLVKNITEFCPSF